MGCDLPLFLKLKKAYTMIIHNNNNNNNNKNNKIKGDHYLINQK